jgi:hypothetical protein
MGMVRRTIRSLIKNPLRTAAIVAILSVSTGLALMRCTHWCHQEHATSYE